MTKTYYRLSYNFKKAIFTISSFVYSNLILIILISSVLLIFAYFNYPDILPKGKEIESILAVVLLYSGIIYNLVSYKIANDQFFKSLFLEFNNRFDAMNEDLNAILKKEYNKSEIKKKDKESIIIDYLNLCAEEYLWFTKGRIDIKVWKSWKKGMEHYLMHETLKKTLNKQREEKNSYYEIFDLIDYEFKQPIKEDLQH